MATKEPLLASSPPTVEVERKFAFTDTSEQKLQENGAVLLQQRTFTDVYYDVPGYRLTLSDHWLRQRDGTWELKCPPVKPSQCELSKVTCQYSEITLVDEIIAKCASNLGIDDIPIGTECINGFLSLAQCKEFATIKTDRKTYSLNEFRIDLDVTDFGFRVGEIEVLVLDEHRIADALSRIDMMAKTLGFQALWADESVYPYQISEDCDDDDDDDDVS